MFAVSGMLFKAASFVISYVFLAKAESKLFVINETVSSFYIYAINIIGYYLGGLTGLGIAFGLGYIIYFVQVFIIARVRYRFYFTKSFKKIFSIQFVLVFGSLLIVYLFKNSLWRFLSVIAFIICTIYSLIELNRRLKILSLKKKI